jgi:hypothetical protein
LSLLKPTTGDIWDRIIVLQLKLDHALKQKKSLSHFANEMAALGNVARTKMLPSKDKLDRLKELHRLIWDGIDLMLSTKADAVEDSVGIARHVAKTAIDIQAWNAERIQIKHDIDKTTGEYVGEEKV